MYSCVHTHTNLTDGKNSPDDMARAAYEQGIKVLGFSEHCYDKDANFGLKPSDVDAYCDNVDRLKKEYAGRMDILCGIEMDGKAPENTDLSRMDYVIGSSHFVLDKRGVYVPVDHTLELLKDGLRDGFDGSYKAFIESYCEQFCDYIKKLKPDIIGHIDLYCKYNANGEFFDESAKWYRKLAISFVDELLSNDIVIEMNTGAISRGYMSRPYPDTFLLKRILEKHGRMIITSDSHSKDTLKTYFNECEAILKNVGFTEVCDLTPKGFITRKL